MLGGPRAWGCPSGAYNINYLAGHMIMITIPNNKESPIKTTT